MVPWVYEHILTLTMASPLLGIAILLIIPRKYEDAASEIAIASSGLSFFLSLLMLGMFNAIGRFEYLESYDWLSILGASFSVGLDGLSVVLVFAVSALVLLLVLANWKRVRDRQKETFASLLAFEIGFIGCFASLDILLMYMFLEFGVTFLGFFVLLIRREHVRLLPKFAGFMSFSSLLFLLVVVFLMLAAGSSDLATVEKITLTMNSQILLFVLLVIGASTRMGIFPFHGWVREFAGEPHEFNLLPAGLVFISGGFILYRFLPAFATAANMLQPTLVWIVAASIVISALISMAQKGFAGLLVYIFMVQFGFVLLGLVSINPHGFAGSLMQMISAIISLSAMTAVFTLLRKRKEKSNAWNFDGIFAGEPVAGLCFFVIMFALAGLPALSHFPGLFMIWMGLFKSSWVLAIVAIIGMVMASAALVKSVGLALYMERTAEKERRIRLNEVLLIAPFILLILGMGIFPDVLLNYVKQSTEVFWNLFSLQI